MNRGLIIVLVVLLVLGILSAGAFLLLQPHEQAADIPTPSFPLSTTTTSASRQIPLMDGSSIQANDFIDNGVTIEDPANEGNYYLAGSSGYCFEDGTCPTGAKTKNFNIVYFSGEGSFAIALTAEPLGASRMAAEQFLMETLGIPQAAMCALNYYIATDAYTNEQYAGTNLGFSFCPGAVVLPN